MRDVDFSIPDNARISPQLLMGAASPLWGYFAGAAMSGVAFWWMTRWTEAVNLEALMTPIAATEPAVEAKLETVEVAVEAVTEPAVETIDVVEAAAAEVIEAAPEPVAEVIEVTQPAPELAPEPAPAPRARKAAAPIIEA